MRSNLALRCGAVGLAGLAFAGATLAATTSTPFGPLYATVNNPCATFNVPVPNSTATAIAYGEAVPLTLTGHTVAVTDAGSLKFLISARGEGVGAVSGVRYHFNTRLQVKANTSGPVLDPNFQFSESFKLTARLVGQGSAATVSTLAQGAQDNATFQFAVRVRYANGQASGLLDAVNTQFTLACQASPWSNQMAAPREGSRTPVGRGFGDPWNKYAWSMQDFKGGMLVGTKNATFDIARISTYGDSGNNSPAALCYRDPSNLTPDIYRGLACAELFEAPAEIGTPATTDTRFAEIWRLDHSRKTWSRVRDDTASQGFRIMATHGNKLFVGSDLGAFVSGVDLKSGSAGQWNFPGSRLLVSSDGVNFTAVPCDSSVNGPCNAVTGSASVSPDVNTSFRALASYGGKLYLGTFNATGGELWSYDAAQSSPWTRVFKFSPANANPFPFNGYHPAVTELAVFNNRLYIGLGGTGHDYLRVYDGNSVSAVPGLPTLPSPTNIGTLKLFASARGQLYIGSVDLSRGFTLQTLDTAGNIATVTASGFGDPSLGENPNAYAWSMAEVNGRTFVGTFNTGFFDRLPRGAGELWYSDDSVNWQQMALPLDFGFWNYGLRTMVVANKQLFVGTASAIIAPDLIAQPVPLAPGAEVWTIGVNAATAGGR